MFNFDADILENDIIRNLPDILEILLKDRTSKKNIIWATNDYDILGKEYRSKSQIKIPLISEKNTRLIMPRILKEKEIQRKRSKEKAEVFTPSWICNMQNNLIDEKWFGRKNVFNKEVEKNRKKNWKTIEGKIKFPKNKTWTDYIKDIRMEITCGEGPYITSRYDTTTGEFIEVKNRIGFLDRKLRIINENTETSKEWLKWAYIAYQSTYGYEWQGDNLLLTREALVLTFIENYYKKFKKYPKNQSIKKIAEIISWNIWQMDGLKMVIPNSCENSENLSTKQKSLFGDNFIEKEEKKCLGCEKNDITTHIGKYCLIMDWTKKDKKTKKYGVKIKFIDLITKELWRK